ncbi:MAG TPA: hypothetical protein VMG11_14825 [Steroidobacteraceae bacterium]|nr:hypothetical protein [Steroidobacteraceae bacterium]
MRSRAPVIVMRQSLAMVAAVLLTAGGTLQADPIMWRGKTVAVAVYPPSRLQIVGAGAEFVIGATGGLAEPGNAAGAKLQGDNAIDDPALHVARSLFLVAHQQYAVVAAPDVAVPRLANPKELTHAAQGVDLLLDVSATSSVVKKPFSSRYWVNTNMFGRAIDVRTGKVFADSFCQMVRGGDPDPLTYEELIAENAAHLKAILAREANACLEKFKADVLGIRS